MPLLRPLAAAVAIALGVGVAAGPRPMAVDPSHSQINFVAESRFLSAHGHFRTWEAEIAIDPDTVERSTVKITIDAASIDTRVERRDTHLRSKDFFDVASHPRITFVSKRVVRTGPEGANLVGDLTIRGTTKEVTVPVRLVFHETARARFKGQFTIDRMDYGVSYNSVANPIDREVLVQWDIALREPRPAGAAPAAGTAPVRSGNR